MTKPIRRIAVNCGSGYVPGLDIVLAGVARAAHGLGWEVVGIRDGYDGLLCPEQYPDGGLLTLTPGSVEALGASEGSALGTGARHDPFRMRSTSGHEIDEIDRSDELLRLLDGHGIDAMVSIVGGSAVTGLHALSVAFKLARKGLRTACVPKSVENDIAGVPQAFGYSSVLAQTTETLRRVRAGAHDARRIAVVELPGQHAGWLALQSGTAALADAVLIPEIAYDLAKVVEAMAAHERRGGRPVLVVVAEGARPVAGAQAQPSESKGGLRASLTPNADPEFGEGRHVIDRSGAAAQAVAVQLQRLLDRDTLPLALGALVRGGAPSAVDRQLGLAFGAGAVRALHEGQSGVMVTVDAAGIQRVPLAETLNAVRTIPSSSGFTSVARALGISLGD